MVACKKKSAPADTKKIANPAIPGRIPAQPIRLNTDTDRPAPRINASQSLPAPQVTTTGKDQVAIGTIHVDLARGRVEVAVAIAQSKGILEYLAVAKGGKAYESAFSVDSADALQLHLALILLDLHPGKIEGTTVNGGDGVRVLIRDGSGKEVPAMSLLVDRSTGKPSADVPFVFTGEEGKDTSVQAEKSRSLVAIWPDSTALVNLTGTHGNPYRGSNLGYEVDADAVVALPQPLTIVFERAAPAGTQPARPR